MFIKIFYIAYPLMLLILLLLFESIRYSDDSYLGMKEQPKCPNQMKTWLSIQVVHLTLSLSLSILTFCRIVKPLEKLMVTKGCLITYTREGSSKIGLGLCDVFSVVMGAMLLEEYRSRKQDIIQECSKQPDYWMFDIIHI